MAVAGSFPPFTPLGGLAGGALGELGVNAPPITSAPVSAGQAAQAAEGAATAAGNSVTSPLDAVVKIWDKLSSRALWIRIAEGLLGGGLIVVALVNMTGAKNVAGLVGKVVR